VLPGIARA